MFFFYFQGISRDEEVLLRFSIKESIYKAMHPLICQYVGFQEAEVQPQADGSVLVRLALNSGAQERFGTVTAHWRKLPDLGFFLTSASVRLKDSDDGESCNVDGESCPT
jgi:4'-phosphopantetheinyl transferase EntD